MSIETYTIKKYINLSEEIAELKKRKANVSNEFYEQNSIVGGMTIDEEYTRSYNPEQAVLLILDREEEIQKYIDRLTRKQAIFLKLFDAKTIEKLQKAIASNKTTNSIKQAILELEQAQKPQELSEEILKKYEQAKKECILPTKPTAQRKPLKGAELERIDNILKLLANQ